MGFLTLARERNRWPIYSYPGRESHWTRKLE